MRNRMKAVGLAAAMVLAAGCVATFDYPDRPMARMVSPAGFVPKPIYVEAFKDARKFETSNRIFLALVPALPYSYKETSHPEKAHAYNYVDVYDCRVTDELREATVKSLRASGLFLNVVTLDSAPAKPADGYTLHSTIKVFSARTTRASYCISIASLAFYILGLPSGEATNRIEMEYSLTDNATGKLLWRGTYGERDSCVHGFYYNCDNELGMFPGLYQTIVEQAEADLTRTLGVAGR